MNNSYKLYTKNFWNKIIKESFLDLMEKTLDLIETESSVSFSEKAR